MQRLIADSSLGGPEAQAIQERAPQGIGRAIALGAQYLARAEDAEAERDRLRAVVGAYQRADSALEDALDDPEVDDAQALARAFRDAQAALLALDVSPTGEDT
jgi:hypothetical protein